MNRSDSNIIHDDKIRLRLKKVKLPIPGKVKVNLFSMNKPINIKMNSLENLKKEYA